MIMQPANASITLETAFALPEGQRFWREHPRIRMLPAREVEADGTAAVTGFASVTSPATIAVVAHRETFQVLQIHESSGR